MAEKIVEEWKREREKSMAAPKARATRGRGRLLDNDSDI